MSTSEQSFLSRRLDPGAIPLVIGDVIGVGTLLSGGVVFHNGIDYLSNSPMSWALTIVPFLLGWILISPFIGAYSAGAAESAKAAIPLAVRAWIPAAILGLVLLASPLFSGGFSLIFGGVILVSGAVVLGLIRWLFFALVRS